MEKDNVYVLFEEIKNKIDMINGKLDQKAGTPTDGQAEEVIPTCVRHIHRHRFDIRSSKVFSLLVGMGVVCSLSLWGNIRLWQSNRQYADDALHEVEKRLSLCIVLKRSYNIICRISGFPVIQLADNHVQPFQVPFHAFLQGKEQIASFRTTDNDTAFSFVPFIRKYPVIRL